MEVRKLKAKDIKTLAKMLGKLKTEHVQEISQLFNTQKKQTDLIQVGLSLFRIVAADLTDDIYAWLADLIGKSIEEFDEMPADTPAVIIKELVKRGEFKDFFGLAIRRAGTKKSSPSSTTS